MIWITKEQIIEFQEKLIRKTGGSFCTAPLSLDFK